MSYKKKRQMVEDRILECYGSMYRIAYTYAGNENDALDIVQESAYKAIKNADSVKKECYIETWIYKIVINCVMDLIKKNKKEVPTDMPEEYGTFRTTDRYRDFDTLHTLDVLSDKERGVVILRFFEDKKLDEIAHILGMKLSTVKSLLYRSLKKLKVEIEKGEIQYEG